MTTKGFELRPAPVGQPTESIKHMLIVAKAKREQADAELLEAAVKRRKAEENVKYWEDCVKLHEHQIVLREGRK